MAIPHKSARVAVPINIMRKTSHAAAALRIPSLKLQVESLPCQCYGCSQATLQLHWHSGALRAGLRHCTELALGHGARALPGTQRAVDLSNNSGHIRPTLGPTVPAVPVRRLRVGEHCPTVIWSTRVPAVAGSTCTDWGRSGYIVVLGYRGTIAP